MTTTAPCKCCCKYGEWEDHPQYVDPATVCKHEGSYTQIRDVLEGTEEICCEGDGDCTRTVNGEKDCDCLCSALGPEWQDEEFTCEDGVLESQTVTAQDMGVPEGDCTPKTCFRCVPDPEPPDPEPPDPEPPDPYSTLLPIGEP